MYKNQILSKVYSASSGLMILIMVMLCIVFGWPLFTTTVAVLVSLLISSPALVSLHFCLWLSQKIQIERSFVWMLLMASIPPLAFIPALVFDDFVPGKTWFLLLLGIFSGYVALLRHGISISQFFKTDQNEKDEQ